MDQVEIVTVELEWVYAPANFLEESVTLNRDDYAIEIANGRVVARLAVDVFDAQPDIQGRIGQELNGYFLGTQLNRSHPFTLKQGGVIHIDPSGRRVINLRSAVCSKSTTSDSADLIITGPDGGIVVDTRRERIYETHRLAELASRVAPTDPTAQKLMECYRAALCDSDNELVRLYEIWEGIVLAFGGGKNGRHSAQKLLNIKQRRLTELANNEPLNQGRHRGCHLHDLRDAAQQELDEARSIACEMIIKYLKHVDNKHETSKQIS